MAELYFKNTGRFIFLVLFQVLILNHVNLGGYVNPYFYIYFILLLPFSTPKWLLLLLSFLLGFAIDLFTHTMGLNTAACVVMAFARPFVISLISGGSDLTGDTPSIKYQDLKWFTNYSVILVVLHHFTLFYLEVFRFSEFFSTLLRVILSSIFTLLLVYISQYLFYPRKK
jgi:cell shape-determining protein MreD